MPQLLTTSNHFPSCLAPKFGSASAKACRNRSCWASTTWCNASLPKFPHGWLWFFGSMVSNYLPTEHYPIVGKNWKVRNKNRACEQRQYPKDWPWLVLYAPSGRASNQEILLLHLNNNWCMRNCYNATIHKKKLELARPENKFLHFNPSTMMRATLHIRSRQLETSKATRQIHSRQDSSDTIMNDFRSAVSKKIFASKRVCKFNDKHRIRIPSRELTYPPKMAFWRWFSFSQGGIC